MIRLKRVYLSKSKTDGVRILVERLWPRGISKEKAAIDIWLKEIAPSTELRKWFNHDPLKWNEFQKRYKNELKAKKELTQELKEMVKNSTVTLVYSSKDEEHNNAIALKNYIENRKSPTATQKTTDEETNN